MKSFLRAWLAFCLAVLIGSAGCTSLNPISRSTAMDKSGWITHCFGRFLIDLPPQAQTNAGYYLWGVNVEQLDETPVSLAARVDQRERTLKAQRRQGTQASLFLRRIPLGNDGVGLLAWKSEYSKGMYSLDTYVVAKPTWRAYRRQGEVSTDREQQGIEIATSLARDLRSREPNEIPTEAGFCIDGGYLAGDAFQSERFDVGITFPDHPGAHFSFSSSTGAEQDRLLDRVGGFLTGAAKLVAGIETLRKGQRNLGPIPAEEFLVAGSDKGQRVYTFAWESQGKDDSLAEPNLTARLGVLERSPDSQGKPPPPAFKSDQDALALWDAIVGTIRLRPGAVGGMP
ncbi:MULTISPECIES: T6SS immunity protein Tli4 family protein [Cupriavidus]